MLNVKIRRQLKIVMNRKQFFVVLSFDVELIIYV